MKEIGNIENCDNDDVVEVILMIEESFKIKFWEKAYMHVHNVGDLVQVVQSYVNYPHHESCTSQSAFYRVRNSIALTQSIDPQKICPGSLLDELFPKKDRRKQVKALQQSLGVNADLLSTPGWVYVLNITGLILSLVALPFSAVAGISGIAIFTTSMVLAQKQGRNFNVHTVGELVQKICCENYMVMRRLKGTANRNEISNVVIHLLSDWLGIDKKNITRDSRFNWG